MREGSQSGPDAGALADLRVLEFTAGMAGPWIGRFMAYFGAEVIKVESRAHPDVTRLYVHPRAPELGPQEQTSPWFTDWNAGKRFVALDLTHPRSIELSKRLVAVCDVVVVNYSAGVLEKLGLGYEVLRRVHPSLIMLSSTGYGESGPNRSYVTWGPNIEALSGLSSLSGFPHRDCTVTQFAYPDALGALHGLFAVLCALEHRSRTGEGQYIDLSQYEIMVAALGPLYMQALATGSEPARAGNRCENAAPQGCFPCKGEERWCAVSVGSDAEWRRLCEVMALPELADDPRFATSEARSRSADAVEDLLENWTKDRDAYDVMAAFQARDIAAGVTQDVEDQLRRDRQLAARQFFEDVDHEVKGTITTTGIPLRLGRTPGRTRGSGSAIGADNDYVFGTLLGMSADEIRDCVDVGAIEPRR